MEVLKNLNLEKGSNFLAWRYEGGEKVEVGIYTIRAVGPDIILKGSEGGSVTVNIDEFARKLKSRNGRLRFEPIIDPDLPQQNPDK